MKMIGLCGRAGAGKNFVADRIIESAPSYVLASFAEALRLEIQEALGTGYLPALWQKPTSTEVRRLLQWWGTDFRRAEDPDYWVKKSEEHALAMMHDGHIPVYADVRFPNEAEMIRRNGGIVVRVLAPIEVRTERLGQLPLEHASETSMDDYPVDAHITSVDNPTFMGQVNRVLFLAEGLA